MNGLPADIQAVEHAEAGFHSCGNISQILLNHGRLPPLRLNDEVVGPNASIPIRHSVFVARVAIQMEESTDGILQFLGRFVFDLKQFVLAVFSEDAQIVG